MSLRVLAKDNSAYEEISSLINKYASGSIIYNTNGCITTDNLLVMIGTINELFSAYSIRKDPVGQLDITHKNLSENFSSFAMIYSDLENRLIFFVSNDERFVYQNGKIISGSIVYKDNITECFEETLEYLRYKLLDYNLSIEVSD